MINADLVFAIAVLRVVLYPEAHANGIQKSHLHDKDSHQHYFKYPGISDSSTLAPKAT